MHISHFRDAKTKTTKDIWTIAWRLQRLNKGGCPDFPMLLLMVNNLLEFKGRRNKIFLMMVKTKRCQKNMYLNQVCKMTLSDRLLLRKIRSEKCDEFDELPF